MAVIPGGAYALGYALVEREHHVTVRPYCLDRTEVTVNAYGGCVTAGACTAPDAYEATRGKVGTGCNWKNPDRALHPVNCVDWWQAVSYCRWAGRRLPTEEEWEWAARNGSEATMYPWGNELPDARYVNACGSECSAHAAAKGFGSVTEMYTGDDGFPETAPVGRFAQGDNRWGVHDLAGNVWEWTSSRAPVEGAPRVIRGGSWADFDGAIPRADTRDWDAPTRRDDILGFRCASDTAPLLSP